MEIDLPKHWRDAIVQWAEQEPAVREVWLFGSRARGKAPNRDVDLAIALMPPKGKTDWASGLYHDKADEWQRHLADLIGCSVSLEGMDPASKEEALVHNTGKLLWRRPMS